MIRSNSEQFAERGDAMDSRVRLDVGLTHEPRRTQAQPDGTLVVVEDFLSWDELPAPKPYKRPYVPTPQRNPEALVEGRLACNRLIRANRARIRFRV